MVQEILKLKTTTSDFVECLGESFPTEEARREYYLKLLKEKLKDPAFRNVDGFPIGKDEDILALSDPPYYTACPNPWLGEFIKHYGTNYDPKLTYHREPFATDVSEGKNDPIYNAHPYHTKVPPRAIARYIDHYTNPGDIVLDMFCGTGMTGVATHLTADDMTRRSVLIDLSPAATWISYGLNRLLGPETLLRCERLVNSVATQIDQDYQHQFNGLNRRILYVVWSDVIACPECGEHFSFWDAAIDQSAGEIREQFVCLNCQASISKRLCDVVTTGDLDLALGNVVGHGKREPVVVVFQKGVRNDRALLTPNQRRQFIDSPTVDDPNLPRSRIDRDWDIWWERDYRQYGIYSIDRFFTNRALKNLLLAKNEFLKSSEFSARHLALWVLTAVLRDSSLMTGLDVKKFFHGGGGPFAGGVKGTFFVPSLAVEKNVAFAFDNRLKSLASVCGSYRMRTADSNLISTQSATQLALIPDCSIDYVFVDPPFGSNFIYSELNLIHESWLGVVTNDKPEAIIHRRKKERPSTLSNYHDLMGRCFAEAYRVLKPGRWITIEFSNTNAAVWNSLQTVLQEVGFVVANVSALDKQQGSFKAVTTTTAMREDLVISAYKPNGGLEERFAKHGDTEEGVWEFVRNHLKNLPVTKQRAGELIVIPEREARSLFSRMVAFYVSRGVPVPLSVAEFQVSISQKLPERDGMYFLPEQVNEFDKKRAQVKTIGQLAIFVEDERSAVDWLRRLLQERPSIIADITPQFMQQLGASWKKWEKKPELRALLHDEFLCYDGTGVVPSQIHSYVSKQFKELRNLKNDDVRLKAKAKSRWFVPDPKNLIQVEQQKNKRLLTEFWSYLPTGYIPPVPRAKEGQMLIGLTVPRPKIPKGKKLKEIRTEAVRVGFKHCYQQRDYQTILVVAEMIPDSVLNEDEQLQMIYDTAVTRTGSE
jgi:DNA modification methylase